MDMDLIREGNKYFLVDFPMPIKASIYSAGKGIRLIESKKGIVNLI
jgi:hypothetical protein